VKFATKLKPGWRLGKLHRVTRNGSLEEQHARTAHDEMAERTMTKRDILDVSGQPPKRDILRVVSRSISEDEIRVNAAVEIREKVLERRRAARKQDTEDSRIFRDSSWT
jgi:hypothetical protein